MANTRVVSVAVSEALEHATRRSIGAADAPFGVLVRAALRLMTSCDPDTARKVIAESYVRPGPKGLRQKVH